MFKPENKMKKVIVAGASGYLGKYLIRELKKQGYETYALVRDTKKLEGIAVDRILQAEVTRPESLKGIFNHIDIVISTVGITRQKDGLTYMDVDYQANLNLLREAENAGVTKFIYVSALNGDHLTHLKMCHAKEKFVNELTNSKIDYCVVRPNGFFSDMTEFLKMAKKGTANLFGDGNYKMNPIHGADLAEVCVDAIESSDKTIEVGGPEVFTHNEIAELAFNVVNKKPKIKYMPEWMRKMILGLTRTFTSSKTYGPMEFFFTVLAMDMIAPKYGTHTLSKYYAEMKSKTNS
jgi:uncharacterized protein YbjT (DUF2867 family)